MGKLPKAVFILALLMQAGLSACVVREVGVQSHALPTGPVVLETPVKAHLLDGSTIVYPDGVTVTEMALEGTGSRYSLTLEPQGAVSSVPLDSVAALESVRQGVNTSASVIASLFATALSALAVAMTVAVFLIFAHVS